MCNSECESKIRLSPWGFFAAWMLLARLQVLCVGHFLQGILLYNYSLGGSQMETGQGEHTGKAQKAATLWFQMELKLGLQNKNFFVFWVWRWASECYRVVRAVCNVASFSSWYAVCKWLNFFIFFLIEVFAFHPCANILRINVSLLRQMRGFLKSKTDCYQCASARSGEKGETRCGS